MAIAASVEPVASVLPPRKRWTREECAKLEKYGLLDAQRYELIEGELIDKMGKNRPHTIVCMLLMRWLGRAISDERVQLEGAIDVSPEDLPISEPEPDLVLLMNPVESYRDRHPGPDQIQLLIEVADASLAFDLNVKAPLYARAGIVEYWVIDINARRLLVFRHPVEGEYRSTTKYAANDNVSPLAAPNAQLHIKSILPPEN
jgi:Uma2 family endonuclease